jgi:type II secretory pathway pseudopilin PulG
MVVALIGILAGLSAPFVLAAKASSNEASAIGSLRALNSSQANYATTCASGSYSTSLVTLVAQGYLSPDMAAPSKSGYAFALRIGLGSVPGALDCAAAVPQSAYYASAAPLSLAGGRRGFATNQSGTIWQDTTGAPPAEPFTTGGPVSPIQ